MPEWEALVTVGRVARPHGLRGHVLIAPETDFPEARFRPGRGVWVRRAGRVERLTITGVRFHQDRPLVALEGIASLTDAETLAGAELRVPEEDLEPLPEGTFYRHRLVGCEVVTVAGQRIGRVTAVEGDLGASRLVVRGDRGEILIPVAAEICREVDPEAGRIVIDPPEGLLDLNTAR